MDVSLREHEADSEWWVMRHEVHACADSPIAGLHPKSPGPSIRPETRAHRPRSAAEIEVMFALQPTAVYASDGGGHFAVVASLFIATRVTASPSPSPPPFDTLLAAMVDWLVGLTPPSSTLSDRMAALAAMLGSVNQPPLGDWLQWRTKLDAFLGTLTWKISVIDPTSVPADAAPLPMLDILQLAYEDENGVPQTIDFHTFNPVPSDYPSSVGDDHAAVGRLGGGASAHGDRAMPAAELCQSFAAYVVADYFLTQARNAVGALLPAARAYEADHRHPLSREESCDDPGRMDDVDGVRRRIPTVMRSDELNEILKDFDYGSAAALGSRHLLGGLRLPVPNTLAEAAPLPVLTGQQYAVGRGAASVSGTLSISPTADVPPGSIVFHDGTRASATFTLPLPERLSPMPAPEWRAATGSPITPANGTIIVRSLPGVTGGPLFCSTKTSITWNDGSNDRTILLLPQALLAQGASTSTRTGDTLQLDVSRSASPTSIAPSITPAPSKLSAIAALLIRLSISRVPSNAGETVASPGSPEPDADSGSVDAGVPTGFLPHVYAVGGPDEAARDLIGAALDSDLSSATVSLLCTTSGSSSPVVSLTPASLQSDAAASTTLIARTNPSALNQSPALSTSTLGEDAATTRDVSGFLRLLSEASVVNPPGLFLFYSSASGEDLPADLFAQPGTADGAQAAELQVVVQFSKTAAPVVPMGTATNCVIVDGRAPSSDLSLDVLRSDGTPVLQYEPAHAAGNVGFSLLWNRMPQSDVQVPVGDLYRLIQYCVVKGGGYRQSGWSLPLGPSENEGPQAPLVSARSWTFEAAVAVNDFYGSPSANRYAVIGRPVRLGFRLVDIYGDALPGHVDAQFLPLYQDPLLTIAQWPGVHWSWRALPGSGKAAQVVVSVTFAPASVVPSQTPEEGARQQWQAILARYALISDQLSDPHTRIALTSTLVAGPVVGGIAERLTSLAARIAAKIQAALKESSRSVDGLTDEIAVSIPFKSLAALADSIFQVAFTMTMDRDPALVDPAALAGLPAARASSYSIPAAVPAAAASSSNPATQFALDFEAAFAGFDDGNGQLKLAQQTGVTNGQDAPQSETYWAVRWSRRAGIAVGFDPTPIFFARAPLSTSLVTGEFGGRTGSNVDVDDWARQFLTAYDRFLSPDLAVAVARLDATGGTRYYDRIARTKQRLASTIANGVESLLENQPAGDLAAARTRFEKALLLTLSSAYTVSTIVQVSAGVTLNGETPSIAGLARAPRLYGSVVQPASPAPVASGQYTLTPGDVSLIPGRSTMTTLLSVTNPSDRATVSVTLDYRVSHLQHHSNAGEACVSNSPSSWLKFTIPTGAALQAKIAADATLPVPLIAMPQAPSILEQKAYALPDKSGGSAGDITSEIADALRWTYAASIIPHWSAQDSLHFDVTYNTLPVGSKSVGKSAAPHALTGLADALATFLQWYNASARSFNVIVQAALPSATGPSATSRDEAKALVATFADLSARVSNAWRAVCNLRHEFGAPPLAMLVDTFKIKTDPTDPKRRLVLGYSAATPSNPVFWPTINDTACRAADAQPLANGWWLQPQPFARTEAVDVAIPHLQIAHHQRARLSAWIVRNGDLAPTAATNPAFVRTTAVSSFSDGVIPLIHRAAVATLEPASSLTATLEAILQPIASTGDGLATSMRVEVSYSFAATRVGSQRLRHTEAVLLMDDITMAEKGDVRVIAANIAQGISGWYQAAMRSSDEARLGIALTLFGAIGAHVPLVQIDDIPIDVSHVGTPAVKWWTT